jgi:hypothetical protein
MTVISPSRLILLDLHDEHEKFEAIFNPQIFRRFVNKDQCSAHILSHLTNVRLLHFFIPKSEHTVIGADSVFLNTIYYLYCMDQASVDEMRQQYDLPMFVKIFNVQSLCTYLCQAAVAHLMEQAERSIHEPDEHDIALQAAAELSDALSQELYNHMIDKIGEQPTDCH